MICGHQTDCEQLQKDVTVLSDRVKIWQMGYLGDNSEIIHMGEPYVTVYKHAVSNTASASRYLAAQEGGGRAGTAGSTALETIRSLKLLPYGERLNNLGHFLSKETPKMLERDQRS